MRTESGRAWLGALALAVTLAGCGPGANDPAQGGVSAKEAEALNDAAAMLDDNGQDAVVETNGVDDAPANAR